VILTDKTITTESIREALDLGSEMAATRDPLAVGSVAVGMILAGVALLEASHGPGAGVAEAHRLAGVYVVNGGPAPSLRLRGAAQATHGVAGRGRAILRAIEGGRNVSGS
jgi:hypothetical protein